MTKFRNLLSKCFNICLFLSVFQLTGQNMFARHASALEMYYRHVSDSTYEFTVVFYRNCQGTPAPPVASTVIILKARSQSLSYSNIMAAGLPLMPNLSPLQPAGIANCSSDTASICYEEYTYRGTFTVPAKARDWRFGVHVCCAPLETDNVSSMTDMYVECGLNNLDFPDGNNSPFWHYSQPNIPGHLSDTSLDYAIKPLCEARTYNLSQQAIEFQNDSLEYKIFHASTYNAVTNGPDSAIYIAPYNFSNPISQYGSGGLTIDPVSGDMWLKPRHIPSNGLNMFLIPVRVTEYRNDTVNPIGPVIVKREIGFTERNLIVIIEDSNSCFSDDVRITFSDSGISNPSTGQVQSIACTDTVFKIYFSESILTSSIDLDGSFLVVRDSSTGDMKKVGYVSVSSTTNITDTALVHMDTLLPIGSYYISMKQGNDSNSLRTLCHYEASYLQDSIKLQVGPIQLPYLMGAPISPGLNDSVIRTSCGISAIDVFVSEEIICSSVRRSGTDFEIFDSNNNGRSMLIDSVVPVNCKGPYSNRLRVYLQSPLTNTFNANWFIRLKKGTDGNGLLNRCRQDFYQDTLLIVDTTLRPDLGPDTSYCANQSLILNAGSTFSDYSWSTGAKTSTIQPDSGGVFWVRVMSNSYCEYFDTVVVTDINPVADFSFSVDDYTVTFTNNSLNAQVNSWDFGDGGSSSLNNPIHIFPDTGWFEVCLEVSNSCDTNMFCDSLWISRYIGIKEPPHAGFLIFPNPANTEINIEKRGNFVVRSSSFQT